MVPVIILKTTLIGKSGKLIAIKPKISDIKQDLLEGGLTTAILEYSKVVQNQDIQSIFKIKLPTL